MPRPLLVLVVLLLPLATSAQSVSSIGEPIRPDRAPLASATEVPAVLLLGLSGPTAALVNPARSARARDRFVYGTLHRGGAPLTFVGIFGTRDRRWLLTADNHIAVREDSETRTQSQSSDFPAGGSSSSSSERIYENESVTTVTRARLLHVGRTDFGGYAFGLFGGYRSLRFEADRTTASTSTRDFPELPSTETRRQTGEQLQLEDNDDFAVGVEAAFAGRTWDLAASVSYQHRSAEAALERSDALDFMSDDPIRSLTEERLEAFAHTVEATPRAVDFEVIGTLRAGRDRDDYLYGAVSGTVGSGTADYASSTANRLFLIREIGGEVVQEESSDSEFTDDGSVDLDTRATQASLGYVYARRARRMLILAAINPTAAFERVESVSTLASFGVPGSKRVSDRTALALNLPLYVRFDVTKGLEAFGGGVYTYSYDRTEYTDRPLSTPSGAMIQTTEFSRTTDFVASRGRLFAGALFTFRSGLVAQASFHGDLAALSGWTASLGYRF
jgi:hypothetical protein